MPCTVELAGDGGTKVAGSSTSLQGADRTALVGGGGAGVLGVGPTTLTPPPGAEYDPCGTVVPDSSCTLLVALHSVMFTTIGRTTWRMTYVTEPEVSCRWRFREVLVGGGFGAWSVWKLLHAGLQANHTSPTHIFSELGVIVAGKTFQFQLEFTPSGGTPEIHPFCGELAFQVTMAVDPGGNGSFDGVYEVPGP